MKRLSIVVLVLVAVWSAPVPSADEGMWTFDNLPLKIWKEKYGFEPTPDWLEKVRLASVRMNDGGSASFVSPDGLLFSNQHVAAGQLQKVSTREKDYVRDGFYAATRGEELKCPDLEVNVLVSLEEVTGRVQGAAKEAASTVEAAERRKAEMAAIEKESTDRTGLRSEVVTLYNGGEYWLYRYRRYTDLRLVFAPEEEIAFFGGDHDNFTYPRFDLDIAFFRVYENDRPARTPHYFSWSEGGAAERDLVFVPGNPGSTSRLLTLAQLQYQRDVGNPLQLQLWTSRRETLGRFAASSPEAARRAGSAERSLENSIKRLVGQQDGLRNPRLMGRKEAEEKALRAAVTRNPRWQREFASAWDEIARAYALYPAYAKRLALSTLAPSRLASMASTLVRYADELPKPNGQRYDEYRDSKLESLRFELLSPAPVYADLEEAVLTGWLEEGRRTLGDADPFVKAALSGQAAASVARAALAGTSLGDPASRKALVDGGPAAINASADPLLVLARRVEPVIRQLRAWHERHIASVETSAGERIARARFAVHGKTVYPDANFTPRIEYGTVLGYEEDTTLVPYKTTFYGLFDRAVSFDDQPPFRLPDRWKARRGALDLAMPLNFVYTADTIGGNSGSPVINRKAEIVGINFDSNLQKLANRYLYIPEEEGGRAVGVASAGIIEALAKVYDADALVAELTGRKTAPKPSTTPDEVLKQVQARLAPDPRVTVFKVATETRGATVVVSGDVERTDMRTAILDGLKKAGHAQVADEIRVVPDPALGERRFGIVRVSVAHIRSRTSQMADQVTELLMGSTVRLLRRQGGWYYAQHDGDKYLGWIEAEHVAPIDQAGLDAWRSATRVMTTSMAATVRDRPDARAMPVSDLVIGNVLRATGRQKKWQAVELPDGRKGYVERDTVQDLGAWEQSRRATPEAIEATARQFLGVPYLWGGTSARGFDCSGYVKTVYWLNGVTLPRDADQQGDVGEPVAIDGGFGAFRKGDLLFFVPSAGRKEPITHVALYLGNGEYLHASGLVKRNSLDPNSPLYSEGLVKRLVRARRIIR